MVSRQVTLVMATSMEAAAMVVAVMEVEVTVAMELAMVAMVVVENTIKAATEPAGMCICSEIFMDQKHNAFVFGKYLLFDLLVLFKLRLISTRTYLGE